MRHLWTMAASLALVLAAQGNAWAADIEIRMLNRGQDRMMVFEPEFVRVQPGDTIHFVTVDKGHNAESIKGMLPEGAEPFEGKMNKDLTVTLTVPGVYGVKCKPHYSMGMVALIAVGKPQNVDEAKAVKHPGKSKQIFGALFEEYDATVKGQ